MHVFCSNATVFVYFGYDWYYMLSFNQMFAQKNQLHNRSFLDFKYYLIGAEIWINMSTKCQSNPKSSKIDAFEQIQCKCHSPTYLSALAMM